MNLVNLDPAEIHVGKALRWDIYDSRGELLFKKGSTIDTIERLDILAEAGIFVEAINAPVKTPPKERVVIQDQPSVIRQLDAVGHRLGPLMHSLHLQKEASGTIMEIAQIIMGAVSLNPDIALASVFLHHATNDGAIQHSLNSSIICALVAQAMKKPTEEITTLIAAALTMNLGMLRQHNEYRKRSTPLGEKERAVIKQHPFESVTLLKNAGVTNPAWLSYVLHHHECEDGSGYPSGTKAADIPEYAKLLALADMFCARITERADRKPMLPSNAVRSMFAPTEKRGSKNFAPFFIGAIGLYPIGTLVKLQSGEYAVVTQKGDTPQAPCVHAYLSPARATLTVPIIRDATNSRYAIVQAATAEEAPLCFNMQRLWGDEALP
jgi:hypothetical protein